MTDLVPPPAPELQTDTPTTNHKEAKAQAKAAKAYAKAQRPWYARKRVIIPAILVLLVILVVALSGGDGEMTETELPAAADADTDASADDIAAEGVAAEEAAAGTRDTPLAIGETGIVGDWEVTIDEVDLDADAIMLDANLFNDDPENGNYGLVTMTATYTGDDEASPWLEFDVAIAGADNLQYSAADAFAVAPEPMSDQPDVETGGTVTGQFALDFPDEALGNGAVLFVEPLISFGDGERVFWQLPTS